MRIGGLCGLLLMPEPHAHAARPVDLAVASEALRPASDLSAQAAAIAQRYLGGTIALRSGTTELRVRRADLGVRVDLDHLQALLRSAADPSSALRRVHDAVLAGETLVLPMPAQLDTERATALLLRMKDTLDRAPADAHIDARKKAAVAARPGVALDVYGSLERIDRALAHGDARVELARWRSRRSATSSASSTSTCAPCSASSRRATTADPTCRTACTTCTWRVPRSTATCSSRARYSTSTRVVGDRTMQAGFKMAPEIADGKLVEGVGGGTCQIASTLHAAVFFAGLPILTRYPHSHPSYYIKLGLDATVVYGSLNFRFQNDRPYPIVVERRSRRLRARGDARPVAHAHGHVPAPRRSGDAVPGEDGPGPDAAARDARAAAARHPRLSDDELPRRDRREHARRAARARDRHLSADVADSGASAAAASRRPTSGRRRTTRTPSTSPTSS